MKLATSKSLCVTDTDRCRLGAFLASHESRIWGAKNSRDKLEVLLRTFRSGGLSLRSRNPRDDELGTPARGFTVCKAADRHARLS